MLLSSPAATISTKASCLRKVVGLKTSAATPKLGKCRINTYTSCVFPRRSVGIPTPRKRHLILQQQIRRLSSSEKSKSSAKPSSSSEQKIVQGSTNYRDVVEQIKSFSIGSLAGLLGSLAGMGGGFVMIPLMTAASRSSAANWWRGGLGLSQHQAHGTSLFAVGTTGLAGALGYGIRMGTKENETIDEDNKKIQQPGLVELDTAVALATTAMVTARLGAISSSFLSERVLKKCLGAFMICVAPLVPGKAYLEALHDINDPSNPDAEEHLQQDLALHTQHKNLSQLERLLPASLIGIFSGFLSGMFGVGGGAIVVPALVLTTDMSHHSALGTSLCAMVLPAMIGTYTHAKRGNVNWRFGPLLALGSAVGAFIGGREIGVHLDEDVLRGGFACLMLVLGVRTWRK